MDKARHPHVVRTWVVERTRTPFHPQANKLWEKTKQEPRGANRPAVKKDKPKTQ